MSDRPILFSAPMVRALLAGRKTQTRRVLKPQPSVRENGSWSWEGRNGGFVGSAGTHLEGFAESARHWARIQPGDRLWVKETWRPFSVDLSPWDIEVAYSADGERHIIKDGEFGERDWTMPKAAARGNVTPLFMPRWASRLTLIVTDIRVEQLDDISEHDAVAEGCFKGKASGRVFASEGAMHLGGDEWSNARDWYADLWDSINGAGAWDANPWVVAYSFTVQNCNIDQIGGAA